MSDSTTQGETPEEYLERIKSAPGIFSDFNETAKDVVERAERLVTEAEHRFSKTSLAPDPHPEDSGPQDGAVGFVYPGTDEKSVTGGSSEEPKDETPAPVEEPVEEEETPAEDVEEPAEEPVVEEPKPAAKVSKDSK